MTFDEFQNQAWSDHANQAADVASRLSGGIRLIEKAEQIPQMANLVTHVFGEHLGKWDEGILLLNQLKAIPAFGVGSESEHAINRSLASLEVASGKRSNLEGLSASDQIRVLAIAASALSEQRDTPRAQQLFREALEKAHTGIAKGDPANRAIAVTGNNLACALEERDQRSPEENDLMVLAANTARKFWEIAGTWLQIERAEYRLARTYLQAGDTEEALRHAQACLEISQDNGAQPLEMFFAYEAIALVEKACGSSIGFTKAIEKMKSHFDELSPEDRAWCKSTLDKLC